MTNHTVSTILHAAADKHLAFTTSEYKYSNGSGHKEKFSCCAVATAIRTEMKRSDYFDRLQMEKDVIEGLKAMGCRTNLATLFRKYGDDCEYGTVDSNIQGMRYMWLKWAALMAEEQGL